LSQWTGVFSTVVRFFVALKKVTAFNGCAEKVAFPLWGKFSRQLRTAIEAGYA